MSIDINQPANPETVKELTKSVKMPSYMRRPIDIDLELEEPEVDLEFKVYDFQFSDPRRVGPHNIDAFMEAKQARNQTIEELLNAGWQIDNQIICPPNVMLIFSREKEEVEEDGRNTG